MVLDIDEQREKALNVALNKISGEFDIPLLTDLLKDWTNVNRMDTKSRTEIVWNGSKDIWRYFRQKGPHLQSVEES